MLSPALRTTQRMRSSVAYNYEMMQAEAGCFCNVRSETITSEE